MKRFNSSDSLVALVSTNCPPKDHSADEKYLESERGYSKEFQAMLDSLAQEDCSEDLGLGKKRRLGSEQVKALERYFEVENKLEPERKAKLAEELGLQPRQVAIWFQNRRARWKAKQLEKDYGLLKANYNSLKLSFDDLRQQNEDLAEKVRELKAKVCRGESDQESSESVKEESPTNNDHDESNGLDRRRDNDDSDQIIIKPGIELYGHPKSSLLLLDGSSSDRDLQDGNLKFSLALNGSSSSSSWSSSSSSSSSSNALVANWFQLSDSSRALPVNNMSALFGSDEPSCNNFFSVDQAPTLYWYFPEQ